MAITKKQFLKYTLLPEVLPRLRDLTSSGFHHVSFFMAQVYRAARILPPTHPYLNGANVGRFGVRQVIAEAAHHLKFDKNHIDQIIVFGVLLLGMALLLLQMAMLAVALFIQTAKAAMPTNFSGFFGLDPTQAHDDLAYVMLDRVFGLPGMFNSCVARNEPCFASLYGSDAGRNQNPLSADGAFPWPFHEALHSMMQMYSIGLLIVALVIFLYYVVVVVAETAQTGTPFGKRFNHVWAPVRMVMALGLLIPVGHGLNGAQYVALYAAKYGSAFATNGWNLFMDETFNGASTSPDGRTKEQLIVIPKGPHLSTLLEFHTVLATCWAAYYDAKPVSTIDGDGTRISGYPVKGYLVRDSRNSFSRRVFDNSMTYREARDFYNGGDILIRFGTCQEYTGNVQVPFKPETRECALNSTDSAGSAGEPVYADQPGHVKELCGDLVIASVSGNDVGAEAIQEAYFNLVKDLWMGSFNSESDYDSTVSSINDGTADGAVKIEDWGIALSNAYAVRGDVGNDTDLPERGDLTALIQSFQSRVDAAVRDGAKKQAEESGWENDMQALGWGGAALWYNKIAQMNGAVIGSAQNLPYVRNYPELMRYVRAEKVKAASDPGGRNAFEPFLPDKTPVKFKEVGDENIAAAMWQAYDLWSTAYEEPSGDIIKDFITTFFGLDGLLNLRNDPNVAQTHPMAQLAGIGKSLVESAIRKLGWSLGSFVGGGVAILFNKGAGSAILMFSDMLFSIAMIGLSVGFVLFYVIPFLPFLYFFFAVGGWVKGLFEAMVGVPLWALAHIRIDGNGLPGDAALGGYFLIFEIFLRPILIIFGFLASISIFAAQVHILHEIWDTVVSNVTGFDTKAATSSSGFLGDAALKFRRGVVDSFFLTVIYAIVVYMLAMASFKLIDLIPNHLLRWLGSTVPTFGERSGDPAENLVRNSFIGSNMAAGMLEKGQGGVMNAAKSAGAYAEQKRNEGK